ncbi:MAG: hypothetical protein ACNA8W_05210 [Bradymonadaceae bacterium]
MKGQKTARDPLDRYYTPEWVVRILIENWPWPGVRTIGEPCAGMTQTEAARKAGFADEASDIDPASPYRKLDFMAPPRTPTHELVVETYEDLTIVSNPPYTTPIHTAADFVSRALDLTDQVAMLLRLPWLEPCEDRLEIFQTMPPDSIWVLPRVHFEGPNLTPEQKNPGATSCWFLWGAPEQEKIRWFGPKDEARARGQLELVWDALRPSTLRRV